MNSTLNRYTDLSTGNLDTAMEVGRYLLEFALRQLQGAAATNLDRIKSLIPTSATQS